MSAETITWPGPNGEHVDFGTYVSRYFASGARHLFALVRTPAEAHVATLYAALHALRLGCNVAPWERLAVLVDRWDRSTTPTPDARIHADAAITGMDRALDACAAELVCVAANHATRDETALSFAWAFLGAVHDAWVCGIPLPTCDIRLHDVRALRSHLGAARDRLRAGTISKAALAIELERFATIVESAEQHLLARERPGAP